ncbi:Gfo/Idh/MocA family protein [Rhizobium phaseoli]|uniref:Gfo/Idh/MocA family protein n=1 Tax=Rhizobium phaseoli TaxID=396 RepID=UPI0014382686|nr:Gfo/Idh/MocA family oxidoreductase [Rhizobium phaseoli]MDK4730806.1 Gfo/Idh/MocA family oxidoreductase [Rhizobium phaseoli]NKE92181.1 Gfo/Idh/MocA family oxidoreductase [Rhizobium phaseoli]
MSLAVGVIGAGVMGSEHARILKEATPGAHLSAVCDADEARARKAAGDVWVTADALDLIRSDRTDAVVIAAPDATHAGLVLACIEEGKPVLCEKPLATTAAEARSVVEAEIKASRRLVQVGYMRRFDPAYVEMKRLKDEGVVGSPVILHNVHRNPLVPTWFAGPMSVTNAFVHEIDASRWLLGSEMVSAHVRSLGAGDPLLITMETDKGELVSTEVFMNCRYGYHVHAELVGRKGTLQTITPRLVTENLSGFTRGTYPDNWIPRFRNAYIAQLDQWVKSIRSQVPGDGASAWDGYLTTKIADEIVAAMASGVDARLAPEAAPALYR